MSIRTVDRASPRSSRSSPRGRHARLAYWLAALITVLGVIGGIAWGVTSYRDSQRDLDNLDRVSVPGAMIVPVTSSTDRVVYYEGGQDVSLGDLSVNVTDPAGVNVPVRPYDGDLVYEKLDLTKGRAVATFHADRAGGYLVKVTGAQGGHLTVGESFARHALPGVLAGVGIAVLSVITGTALWVVALIRARRGMEGERP